MTRSEAIDMIRQIASYLTAGNPVWRSEPIREACDMAIEALTEKEPSAEPRWIPASERLPEEPFGCIVSYHGFMLTPHGEREYDAIYPELLGYDGSGWNNSEGECVDNMIDVTAWMPLPQPWKGTDT